MPRLNLLSKLNSKESPIRISPCLSKEINLGLPGISLALFSFSSFTLSIRFVISSKLGGMEKKQLGIVMTTIELEKI